MRPADLFGGIDYGKWKLWSIGSVPFNTPAPPDTNVPGSVTVGETTYPGIPIAETGILRVAVAVNPGVVFKLSLTRGYPDSPVQVVAAYNGGAALAANSIYLFDAPVQKGDVVNFQFGGMTSILMLDAYLVITMGP